MNNKPILEFFRNHGRLATMDLQKGPEDQAIQSLLFLLSSHWHPTNDSERVELVTLFAKCKEQLNSLPKPIILLKFVYYTHDM